MPRQIEENPGLKPPIGLGDFVVGLKPHANPKEHETTSS
jgi:hypothetical protein